MLKENVNLIGFIPSNIGEEMPTKFERVVNSLLFFFTFLNKHEEDVIVRVTCPQPNK